jgi:hypothetical protein
MSSGALLWTRWWTFGFNVKREVPWPAQKLRFKICRQSCLWSPITLNKAVSKVIFNVGENFSILNCWYRNRPSWTRQTARNAKSQVPSGDQNLGVVLTSDTSWPDVTAQHLARLLPIQKVLGSILTKMLTDWMCSACPQSLQPTYLDSSLKYVTTVHHRSQVRILSAISCNLKMLLVSPVS